MQKATEQQIKEMKIGDVFIHPFNYIGPTGICWFVITSIGSDDKRFGKFDKLLEGEYWVTHFEDDNSKFVEKEKMWAGNLTKQLSAQFAKKFQHKE